MKHVILSREIGLILDPSSRAPWRRQHPGFSEEADEAFHDLLEELVGPPAAGASSRDNYRSALVALTGVDFHSPQTSMVRSILEAYFAADEKNQYVSTEAERDDPNWIPDGMHYVVAKLV